MGSRSVLSSPAWGRGHGGRWGLVGTYMALAAFLAVAVASAWTCDDYFFSLKAAWHLWSGHCFSSHATHRVQGFTNPLWTLLLAANFNFSVGPYITTILLSLLISLATALLLPLSLARTAGGALFGLLALTCSKAFIDYSTSGLENPLSHLLYLGFLAHWHTSLNTEARSGRLMLLAALMMCNRLDLALLVLPHLLKLSWSRSPRRWLVLVAGSLPLVAWLIFALAYYGSPLPNTAWVKLSSDITARGLLLERGWSYLVDYLAWDRVTLPLIFAGLVAGAFLLPRRRGWCTTAGVCLYLLYIVWIGGDFMAGRFLSVPLAGAVAMLIRLPRWGRPGALIPAALLLLVASLSSDRSPLFWGQDKWGSLPYGVEDERVHYDKTMGLLSRWRHGSVMLRQLPRQDTDGVVCLRLSGRHSYPIGPGTHVVNLYGLTDPLLARLPVKDFEKARAGHVKYSLPAGYLETLRSGKNRLQDPRIAALWEDLVLATRQPIFTQGRGGAIWRLNTGYHDLSSVRDMGNLNEVGQEMSDDAQDK